MRRAFRNTYMLTVQMSSSDRRHYAVPVSGTCSFPQPYFLYRLESAVENNAFSHSTQANRRIADPVRAVTAYWECRYSAPDVSQLYASVALAPETFWVRGWADHRTGLARFNMRNPLPLSGIELRFLGLPGRSLDTTPSTIPWLPSGRTPKWWTLTGYDSFHPELSFRHPYKLWHHCRKFDEKNKAIVAYNHIEP